MKVIRVEKFRSKKLNTTAPKKPPPHLRRSDWGVLMRHDRLTGKLDMRSKEIIRDPGSVKRLLEAEMIDPDGILTPEARKKCAALAEKLPNRRALISADPVVTGDGKPFAAPGKKVGRVSAAHWAVLMKYDRKTGNLLRTDPQTGQLDKTSRLILKEPSIIQCLVDKNLILPGGWLTPEAKQGCVRLEKKIKARAQDNDSGPGDRAKRKSKDEPEPEIHLEHKSKKELDLQAFFENLPDEPESEIHSERKSETDGDLQAFFENLP